MDLVWRVSGSDPGFPGRHNLSPIAVHGASGFNAVVAGGLEAGSLDATIAGFLSDHSAAIRDLAGLGGSSELCLGYFLALGEEYSAGVSIEPETLSALGGAGIALAVTVYLCEEDEDARRP